jgi:MFS family permease
VLVYVLTYGILVVPVAIIPQIRETFHIGMTELGVFSSAFLYSWIIMQIPAGILLDHYDSRKLLCLSTVLIGAGCLLQAFTTNYGLGILSRLIIGAASSFSLIGAIYLSRQWFSILLLPIMIGIAEGSSGLAEIGFPVLFAHITKSVSWLHVMFYLGIVAFVLAILVWLFVRDKPLDLAIKHRLNFQEKVRLVVTNKYLWGLGLYVGFAIAYYVIIVNMWGVVILRKVYGLPLLEATYVNSSPVLGFMIGGPIIGWISRSMPRRILIFICMLLEFILLSVLINWHPEIILNSVLLFILGFVTGAIILAFDMSKEIIEEKHYALAVGFINIFFAGIGVVIIPLMGFLLMLHTDSVFYRRLVLEVIGAIGLILSAFIAWRYKFDTKQEFEKK